MKKFVKGSLAIVGLMSLGITTASAKTMTAEDIAVLSKTTIDGDAQNRTAYILGKNIYFNEFSLADVSDAAQSFKDGGSLTYEVYFKTGTNSWTNKANDKTLSSSEVKNLKFEVAKVVGTKSGDNVSSSEYLKDNSTDFVNTVDYAGDRKADIYIDESVPLKVAGMRLVEPSDVGTTVDTNIHKYNTSAVNVNFDGKKLTITENTPLLGNKKVALLVSTNKKAEFSNVTVSGGVADTIKSADFTEANKFGGNDKEFILWVNAASIVEGSKLTFNLTEKIDGKNVSSTQEVALEYTNIPVVYELKGLTANDKVESTVAHKEVTLDTNSKEVVFYSNDKKLEKIEYTTNSMKKVAIYENSVWSELSLLNKPVVAVSEGNSANQKAIKAVSVAESSEKDIDYIVTVDLEKEVTDDNNIKLDVDFGVLRKNLTISKNSVNSETNLDKSKFVATLDASKDLKDEERTVTITNKSSADKEITDKVVVKFVYNRVYKAMTPSVKLADNKDLYPNSVNDSLNKLNSAYKDNMSNVTAKFNSETNEVTIYAGNGAFKKFDPQAGTVSDTGKNYVALVLNLGVNLTTKNANNEDVPNITVSGSYKLDTSAVAKEIGATGDNTFVIWVEADKNETLKFTNSETKETVDVKVVSQSDFKDLTIANGQKIEVVDTDKATLVSAEGTTAKFRVNKDVTSFVIKVGTKEEGKDTYKYVENTVVINGNDLTLVPNPVLSNNIYAVKPASDADYAQNSVKNVKVEGNTIYVDLTRKLDNTTTTSDTYKLLVDFGVADDNLIINGTAATAAITTDLPEALKEVGNYVVLTVSQANSDKADGYKVVVKNGTSVEREYIVKSTTATDKDLKLNNIKNIVIPQNYDAATAENIKYNNGALKTATIKEIEDNGVVTKKVVIPYFKDFKVTANSEKRIGLLINLGVDPTKVTATGATIETQKLSDYGSNDSKDILIWLDAATATDGVISVTFTNGNDNKYDTLVVDFELKREVEVPKLMTGLNKEIKVASSIVPNDLISTYTELYKANQDRFSAKLTAANTLTITPVDSKVTSYETYKRFDKQGETSEAWFAVALDLGLSKDLLAVNGTNVEVDWDLAKKLSNSTDTTFVLWVKGSGDLVTFTNSLSTDTTENVEITIDK